MTSLRLPWPWSRPWSFTPNPEGVLLSAAPGTGVLLVFKILDLGEELWETGGEEPHRSLVQPQLSQGHPIVRVEVQANTIGQTADIYGAAEALGRELRRIATIVPGNRLTHQVHDRGAILGQPVSGIKIEFLVAVESAQSRGEPAKNLVISAHGNHLSMIPQPRAGLCGVVVRGIALRFGVVIDHHQQFQRHDQGNGGDEVE